MKTIMVATDFSERSDRALRRATLLARQFGASIVLMHVVDDDQPERIAQAERAAATAILKEQARTLREQDGVDCDARVVAGMPIQGIAQATEDLRTDLVVIGPHRRQALKDVFVGTTAERAIRASRRPILMANGVPAAPHRHALVAVDLSECSADALRALKRLGIERNMAVSVIYVFDAMGAGLMVEGSVGEEGRKDYLQTEEERASQELAAFLAKVGFDPLSRQVARNDSSTASVIARTAQDISADLVVVGTRGRTGVAKLMLGSVAQEVLRVATVDVLAVPPGGAG